MDGHSLRQQTTVLTRKLRCDNEKVMLGRDRAGARDSHSNKTDWDQHALMDLPVRYVNRVCGTANLGIQDNALAWHLRLLCASSRRRTVVGLRHDGI